MRTLFVFALATLMTLTAAWAQQAPAHKLSTTELIAQLRSDDAQVRSGAFESVRTDTVALRDPKVRAALIELLDKENHEATDSVKDQRHTKYIGPGEDEAGSEYIGALADSVAKIVDWSSARQVCILADSVFPPPELAAHAKVAVPCLLHRSNAPPPVRGYVVALLVQALSKGRGELDAVTIQAVRQIILSALHDPDDVVKIPTVKALGSFGGEDMIPALRNVAETDPDPSEGYAIRKWAAEAIAAIQKRAGQQQQ
jgi:HEAT repeat protein